MSAKTSPKAPRFDKQIPADKMKDMAKKNLTINDLATQIDNQGKILGGRIDELADRVGSQGKGADARMNKTDARFDELIKTLETRFDDMDKQFQELKLEVHGLSTRIDVLEAKINERFNSLERMVKEDIGTLGDEIYNVRSRLNARLDKIEKRYLKLRAAK